MAINNQGNMDIEELAFKDFDFIIQRLKNDKNNFTEFDYKKMKLVQLKESQPRGEAARVVTSNFEI